MSERKSVEIPATKCRSCGYDLEMVTGVNAGVPDAGSVSICFGCGALSIFNANLTMREPTMKEQAQIEQDPFIQKVMRAWAEQHKEAEGAKGWD